MADAMRGCVREADNSFANRTPTLEFFRDVGATLVQKKALPGPAVTIEWIERRGRGSVDWHYRQDRDALFYFEQGVLACHGALDGGRIDRQLNGATNLAFIEACSTIETEVEISGRCLYWVAFIDKARLLGDEEEILRPQRLDSRIGFDNAALAVAVKSLRAELTRTDDLSNLYIESWAIQALVHLHRSFDDFQHQSQVRLTKNEISKVVEFMEANIAENITLECIATLVGLSPRHFRRLFRASAGVGPHQMFTNMRLERAARDLRHSQKNVTEISFDCGFSQPQHLATAFRRKFGLTPTEFRRNFAS
jgi:AraC family transcriptional regulator